MSRKRFFNNVITYVRRSGKHINPRIICDDENGRYVAYCGECVIIGRPSSDMLTIRFGSGHQVMVKAIA